MFMFQNGLLVTFIPEILMVIGYVLCLFATGNPPQPSSTGQNSSTAQVITFDQHQHQHISGYQVSVRDFQPVDIVADIQQIPAHFISTVIKRAAVSDFSTSDGLNFVDFSRPPPVIIS